ncbi:MAG: tRNA pseudouridine(55) synthase TruB [Clostridia bacterium]|nr:tRNA pseudouridine(55) synthase TruB [Clostridia bacterium]
MNGILCVDKPQDMTSFSCCALLRRLTGERKAGHAGTLDPMATGVLPLMFGKATRAIPLLPTHNKRYRATLQFGKRSDTLDIWGAVSETGHAVPTLSAIEDALPAFRGEILQVPPMMSALKKDGVRLYDLARQGIEIERQARPITIHTLEVMTYDDAVGQLQIVCDCSAGTYIRTLCDDLGRVLGCGAVMTALRREAAAGYTLAACLTPDDCRRAAEDGSLAEKILPVESAFTVYPAVTVTAAQAVRFRNGGELAVDRVSGLPKDADIVCIYDPEQIFLGLGRVEEQAIRIVRIFV